MRASGTVTILVSGKEVGRIPCEDMRLLDLLAKAEIYEIPAPCGGNGQCGKCLVRIVSGHSPELHPDEQRLLTLEQVSLGFRLACRMSVERTTDLTIDISSDLQNVLVRTSFKDMVHTLAPMSKQYRKRAYGCAIDIGTTTVVVYLARLDVPEVLDHRAAMNKQCPFGADVVSRIQYVGEHLDGLHVLQQVIVSQLDAMILDLALAHAIDVEELVELVAVGNPTMLHLLLGKNPASIAVAPYISMLENHVQLPANSVGFQHTPTANLSVPGVVSAFVGSDITAGIFSSGLMSESKPVLYLDIGTNGETVLWDGSRLLACSSAAGPAFEGASISQGSAAFPGAIDRIWSSDSDIGFSTIGNLPGKSLCGSGIIDAVAIMLHLGLIDETGAMDTGGKAYARHGILVSGIPALQIAPAVAFTNKDVREVQLAKAAIAAGWHILLNEAGLEVSDLDAIIVAGGFGSYIHIQSAQRIGLLPAVDIARIQVIGNAAGKGALDMLMEETAANHVEQIRSQIRYIELATSASFQESFMQEMLFSEASTE